MIEVLDEAGDRVWSCRIENSRLNLEVELRSIVDSVEGPEAVVIEATWGRYWAADVVEEVGLGLHLAHRLAIKGYANRRVKTDWLDAELLADRLPMGRLPEAWIAPQGRSDPRDEEHLVVRWSTGAHHREIAALDGLIHRSIMANDEWRDGYQAIQVIGGVGRVLAAVFVTEIGDINRFRTRGRWRRGLG